MEYQGQKGVFYVLHTGMTWQDVFLRRVNAEPKTWEEIVKEKISEEWSVPDGWKPTIQKGNCFLVYATESEAPLCNIHSGGLYMEEKGVFVPDGEDGAQVFEEMKRELEKEGINFHLVDKPLYPTVKK